MGIVEGIVYLCIESGLSLLGCFQTKRDGFWGNFLFCQNNTFWIRFNDRNSFFMMKKDCTVSFVAVTPALAAKQVVL